MTAIKVLDSVAAKFNFNIEYQEFLLGGSAVDETGVPLPEETINGVQRVDAVLSRGNWRSKHGMSFQES